MATLTRPLGPILALATLAAAGTGPAPAAPLPERAHAVVDYDIRVRLDAEEKRLSGEERLVWRNPASEPIGELWFHLYLNAFRNSKSTFFRESGGGLWRGRDVEDGWGGIDITSIRRADGVDLAGATSFEHPDDDNDDDRTVLRVRLPEPVPPGEIVTLDLAFEARLPGFLVRTGYVVKGNLRTVAGVPARLGPPKAKETILILSRTSPHPHHHPHQEQQGQPVRQQHR